MRKEEVIKKIDELSVLLSQMKKILRDYEGIISRYSDNDLKYSYNDCEYWENILANSRQNILNYWDESENDLDESIEENNSSAQEIRDTIYSMLMTHSDYFRKDFGGQFDSDDDVEMTIDEIVNNVKNGKDINYVKQPSYDFDEKLQSLVREYIKLGDSDDIIAQDGI